MAEDIKSLRQEMVRWAEKHEARFLQVLEKQTVISTDVGYIKEHLSTLNGNVERNRKRSFANENEVHQILETVAKMEAKLKSLDILLVLLRYPKLLMIIIVALYLISISDVRYWLVGKLF